MTNTNSDALNSMIEKLKNNFEKSNCENIKETNIFVSNLELMNSMLNSLKDNRAVQVLQEVIDDLLNSLIFSYQGCYRYSYVCLRSSIELLLSFLYYADNYYDFVLWKNDCIDMTWTQLTNCDKGVFNDAFLSIVNQTDISTKNLLAKYKDLYHITSQYVHGKFGYMQNIVNSNIEYSSEEIKNYFGVSLQIIEIENLMIYLRFNNEKNLGLSVEDKQNFKHMMRRYGVKNDE